MAPRLHTEPSNVSAEAIASYAIECEQAQRAIDEATGRKCAVLKRAKAAGVDTKSLSLVLRLKKLDEDAVRGEMRNMLRYARIVAPHLPLRQSDLFDALDVRPLGAKAQGQVQAWEAEQRGYECGLNGGNIEDSVFARSTEAYQHFQRGFERGQSVIAERMGENAKRADASRTKRRGRAAAAADDTPEAEDAAEAEDAMGEPMGSA